MNSANTLFLSAYGNYLDTVINKSLNQADEVRIISQSMMPSYVWAIFTQLNSQYPNTEKQKIYLKVASGLIKHWQTLKLEDFEQRALSNLHAQGWLDDEDKLTWYRNRTILDEKTDKLIIFLVGLDYTTDKGGLADFFVLNDTKIWDFLGNNYKNWLKEIFDELGIIQSSQSTALLNEYLQQINVYIPMSLSQKSSFLFEWSQNINPNFSFNEILASLFAELPKLGIPYLDTTQELKLFSNKKGIDYLKNAFAFISHSWYKSASNKKNHFEKIVNEFSKTPNIHFKTINHQSVPLTSYQQLVSDFIFNADKSAKQKLTVIDLLPLLKALKIKDPVGSKTGKSTPIFNGSSLEAVLKGVHTAISRYKKEFNFEEVISITIKVTHFQHDFSDDKEQDSSKDFIANQKLIGVLGGIEAYISNIRIDDITTIRFIPLSADGIRNYELRKSNNNPQVTFDVVINGERVEHFPFRWRFAEYQTERLHISLANIYLNALNARDVTLPIFTMNPDIFKAIYYASNQEEACRLLTLGLDSIRVEDLFSKFSLENYPDLKQKVAHLKLQFELLLKRVINDGQYTAQLQFNDYCQAYLALYDSIKQLDKQTAHDVSERLYYAFFIASDTQNFNINQIEQVLITGFHPAAYEIIAAQTHYVLKAFSDIYHEEEANYQKINDIFVHSFIESPILALRQKHNSITTHHKTFDWLHFIGKKPKGDVDLYVQSLLQQEETEYEDDVEQISTTVPEQKIIANVLDDYQKVHNHANDGLRILATHVTQLPALLYGLTDYYQTILLPENLIGDVYSLYLSVHTFELSKLACVNTLKTWQENLIDIFTKKGKILKLKIRHYSSSHESLDTLLKNHISTQQDTQLGRYDLAFSFNFLQSKAEGRTVSAPKITQNNLSDSQVFPIIYYPKPVFERNSDIREIRLSQRQIKIQSCHTNLTAQLQISDRIDAKQFFVLSRMDYDANDIEIVEKLHQVSSWVITIDEYFDHYLLKKNNKNRESQDRKVISFSSGYGNYGELNVTLSTAHHSFEKLKRNIESHLSNTMLYLHKSTISELTDEILHVNEGLSGVANIQSILGEDETIRNLYGYALAIKYIPFINTSIIHEWIPLDAYRHWFNQVDNRPDLLQVSLSVGENNQPILHVCVVETKVGISDLLSKAQEQIGTGLNQLKTLFAPKSNNDTYDRRYWWGQLYRALITRAKVNQVQNDRLEIALEKLAEGIFEIIWTSKIVICKTGFADLQVNVSQRPISGYPHLIGDEQVVEIIEISEASFERILLDKFDWSEISTNVVLESKNIKVIDDINIDEVPIYIETPSYLINALPTEEPESTSEHEDLRISSQEIIIESTTVSESPESIEPQAIVQTLTNVTSDGKSVNNHLIFNNHSNNSDILIGTSGKGNQAIFWAYNHMGLPNRHMIIFGSSGSGKTYAIQAILSELATSGISSFIVDYTDGFMTHQSQFIYREVTQPAEYFVRIKPLPINPFKRYSAELMPGTLIQEEPFHVALRVKNILSSVFTDFGSQQLAIIDKVLEEGLTEDPNYKLEFFLDDLEDNGPRGESIANKIRSLIKLNPFDTQAENNIYEEDMRKQHPVQIIQLAQIPKDLQRIITEFVLWDLWAYVQKHGNKDIPITIVLDEMQNLDHRPDSPIDKLLREGRKFGISLILATQTISNFNQEQKDRLFQASTKLFFKPATTETANFADLLSKVSPTINKNEWIEKLNSLEKGECFFIGNIENEKGEFKEVVRKVSVTALEQRSF